MAIPGVPTSKLDSDAPNSIAMVRHAEINSPRGTYLVALCVRNLETIMAATAT